MDPNRLSTGEKLLGISALLLFITSFIPLWGKIEVSTDFPEGTPQEAIDAVNQSSDSFSLWQGYGLLPKIGVLIAFVLVALVVARAMGALDRANLPVPAGIIYLVGGGLVALTMLLALFAGAAGENEASFGGVTYEAERGLLLFLGVILGLATLADGFLHMQAEGSAPTAGGLGGSPTGPPPQTPPGT